MYPTDKKYWIDWVNEPFGRPPDYAAQLAAWQKLYRNLFGIRKRFSKIVVPEKREGFDRLIIVAEGMTPERCFQACKESFFFVSRHSSENLDAAVPFHDRVAYKDYAIWVRPGQDADEDLRNLSLADLKVLNIRGETLPERLLHGLICFRETGRHLDARTTTFCSGSQTLGGRIPVVGGYGKVSLYYAAADSRRDDLRSRQVVAA